MLEILYDELGGNGWTDNTNWKTDKPLDEWYRVSTNTDGRVDSLNLGGNSLTGEIPPELGDLSNLAQLFLDSNSLTGKIPIDFLELWSLSGVFLGPQRRPLCAGHNRIRRLAGRIRGLARPEVRLS